jgi:hypothetical protein
MNSVQFSLSDYLKLSSDDQWNLIDSKASFVNPNMIKTKPSYIGPLYWNTPFPHYSNRDGTTIQLSENNIYEGSLVDICVKERVEMNWKGYTCQLYDGILKLCPINSEAEINGTIENIVTTGKSSVLNFRFVAQNLVSGCYPGFIEMYHITN